MVLWSYFAFLLEFCVFGILLEDLEEMILGLIKIWFAILRNLKYLKMIKYVPTRFEYGACYPSQRVTVYISPTLPFSSVYSHSFSITLFYSRSSVNSRKYIYRISANSFCKNYSRKYSNQNNQDSTRKNKNEQDSMYF